MSYARWRFNDAVQQYDDTDSMTHLWYMTATACPNCKTMWDGLKSKPIPRYFAIVRTTWYLVQSAAIQPTASALPLGELDLRVPVLFGRPSSGFFVLCFSWRGRGWHHHVGASVTVLFYPSSSVIAHGTPGVRADSSSSPKNRREMKVLSAVTSFETEATTS